MGVKRAVELVFKTAHTYQDKQIFTLGPIIHNPQVLHLLEKQGVNIINTPEEAPPGSVVVIRAHGVPPQIKERLLSRQVTVVDATCPRVIKVQQIIRQYFQKGYQIIIIGEKAHPEVKGLMGYADNLAWVANNEEEVKALPEAQQVLVVAQTTQNEVLFKQLATMIKNRYPEVKVFNTVCNSTHERQEEVRHLAKKVEAFVVVGGKMSGNTRRLAQIAREAGIKTYHIETEAELNPAEIKTYRTIGVTAGASTPYWLIRRVIFRLEDALADNIPWWWRIPYKTLKFALLTNLWAATGGAALTIMGCKLNGIYINKAPFIAFFYLWAMHLLNHLTDFEATRLTDPARANFYERYRFLFLFIGLAAICISLKLTSPWPLAFFSMILLNITGLIYNIKIPFLKVKLKGIPGSKTILVPLAWGFLAGIFPLFLQDSIYSFTKPIFLFIYLSSLAFVRTYCFDLLDIQGDQMVGRETLPIVLGEKNSFKLLYFLTGILIFLTNFLAFKGFFPKEVYLYSLILTGFLVYLWQMDRKYLRPGVLPEAIIDGQFILMGMISLV